MKRASPGADVEKNPLGDVDLNDEDAVKLQAIQKDVARVELALGMFLLQKVEPPLPQTAPPTPPSMFASVL